MIEVRDLDAREVNRFYGRHLIAPLKGYAARSGLRTVALGGIAAGTDGRVWGFIDFKPGYRLRAIYRYTLRLLAWAEREGVPAIHVSRDAALPTSLRLLTRAGFRDTGERIDGHEIWAWQNRKVQNV